MYMTLVYCNELNQGETYLEKPHLFDPNCKYIIHWANEKYGAMVDLNNNNVMRFVSYHYEQDTEDSDYDIREKYLTKDDELTSPIVAEGIVVYWLKVLQEQFSTTQIFNSYYDKREKEYIQQNEKALDAWKRNLKREFYENHLQQIQQQIIVSENIYPYLFEKDVNRIKELEANYLEFVKSKIQTNSNENNKEIKQSESTKFMNMEKSVLGKISPINIRNYYEGWRNGKNGSICQQNGIYRFVEMARGKSNMLDDVTRNEEDNPIVAIGIVAYWLQFNSRMDTVLNRLTKYNCEIPKDIREQFDNYTKVRFDQFKEMNRDNPDSWDWDWDFEFYTKYIIPHEIKLNKQSEALFDYISDSDIDLVRAVMKNYIKYLKKTRTEKGYHVNPDLLVLRAIDSKDDSKYEDLEDYEINTILEKLMDEGYIDVYWVEKHIPWSITMLDKGRCYLKQLEERNSGARTKQTVREITWEDEKQCFKTAVLHVMEQKRENEGFLFEKPTQWMAVYRYAVDIAIMYEMNDPREPKDPSTPQYKQFEDFANELQLDINPPTRIPFTKNAIDSINKKNYVRYNTRYPWPTDGITDPRSFTLYTEMENIYKTLEEKYNNLISQIEKIG